MQAVMQQQLSEIPSCLDVRGHRPEPEVPHEQQEDPFGSCVMQPDPDPMDLHMAPSHVSDLPLVEDISTPPPSHLASSLASMEDSTSSVSPPRDPFEGSGLSGFGLLAVTSALLARPLREAPVDREMLLWSLVLTEGGDKPKCIPRGRVE